MIKLYQFRPFWGMPNASPFCMKAETYLRYKGIHYESVPSDPRKSPSKKIPFIVTKTGGKIIEFFEAQSKDKMNDGMTDAERVLHQHWFDGVLDRHGLYVHALRKSIIGKLLICAGEIQKAGRFSCLI